MRPVGVVLAGGAGRRLGGDKAMARLDGVPLLHHVLQALAAVTDRQAVVAKEETVLPALGADVALWREPAQPRHPAVGILHALGCAGGAPVLCVAVDLPLLDPGVLRLLLAADDGTRACVAARAEGALEPLCAIWHPASASVLAPGSARPMRELLGALDARAVDVPDPASLLNVNTPEDLERAGRAVRGA